ncbi:MAG TPA: cytochrome c maturation protein CcmE [Candidatus Angelobacter sp.]|nr:cytochrome c maturation protein CcmE [Candidatus Angelobacter sp.]
MTQQQRKVLKFGGGTAVILIGLAFAAWTGVNEGRSYYYTIPQLHGMDESMYSKHIRVGGTVEPGSIHQAGTNVDFVLVEVDPKTQERQVLKVSYKGTEPPPDTFKDDSQALALGTMGRDGVFHATELQAKCASKYAPQQPGAPAPQGGSSQSPGKGN